MRPSSNACTASASRILPRSSVNGIDRNAVARLFCRMANSCGYLALVEGPQRALIGRDRVGDPRPAGTGEILHDQTEIYLGFGQLLRPAEIDQRRDRFLE